MVDRRHVLKNAMLPIITVIGLQTGLLLSGAMLTEIVFAWGGMGQCMYQAIQLPRLPRAAGRHPVPRRRLRRGQPAGRHRLRLARPADPGPVITHEPHRSRGRRLQVEREQVVGRWARRAASGCAATPSPSSALILVAMFVLVGGLRAAARALRARRRADLSHHPARRRAPARRPSTGSASTSSAATSPVADHLRRPLLAAHRRRVAAVRRRRSGCCIGAVAGAFGGWVDNRAHAAHRHHARHPGPAVRDRRRRRCSAAA